MTILLIENKYPYHLEIIESLVKKHEVIIGKKSNNIYLSLMKKRGINDKEYDYLLPPFIEYIKDKYPNIKLETPKNYDFYINATIKPNQVNTIRHMNPSKYFYIAHEPDKKNELSKMKNVYWLSSSYKRFLIADFLPFANQKNMNKQIPIYIIQGAKIVKRKSFHLLDAILKKKYRYNFIIRWTGHGRLPEKYKDKVEDVGGSFIDYHKRFLDCYCLITLISKQKQPQYYGRKVTSSYNYVRGYNLKCLIDKDLQNIYNLPDVEVYNDHQDISLAFEKTLIDFYSNK